MNERTKERKKYDVNLFSLFCPQESENSGEVCDKCGRFFLVDGNCPNCDSYGAKESGEIKNAVFVPKSVEKEDMDIYGNEAPHPKMKFSRLIFDLRSLLLDNSRGLQAKKRYDGKSKQEVFSMLIQRLGSFKREFDKRFLRETILKGVELTDSLNSKIGKYLRNCSQIEREKHGGVYYNNLYKIKCSQIEEPEKTRLGKAGKSDNPYGFIDDDTLRYFIKERGGVISPTPYESNISIYKDKKGRQVPEKVHQKEDVETQEEKWHGYSTSSVNENLFPDSELETPSLENLQ